VRNASTAIYFLLPAGTFSALHRVLGSDEVWHFYAGDALELHTLDTAGARSHSLIDEAMLSIALSTVRRESKSQIRATGGQP
jgi:predicted cupin superfamily sugar epimerase